MRYLLICGLLLGIAFVAWILAGRHFVTLLDRLTLALVEQRGVEPMVCEGSSLDLGDTHVDLRSPAYADLAECALDPAGHLVLNSGGRRFPLGPGHIVAHNGSIPRVEFTKDSTDAVHLTVEQSRTAWLTPFEMNFMTGYSPSRKRNVYFRLRWTKRNGAKLELLWRAEQLYYSRDGWQPRSIQSVSDGLIQVRIDGPVAQ